MERFPHHLLTALQLPAGNHAIISGRGVSGGICPVGSLGWGWAGLQG